MERYLKKRTIWIMIFGSLLFLLLPFSAEAAIKTGGVKIELECYEEVHQGEWISYTKSPQLMPGEEISYVLAVRNHGADAWIRLHISFLNHLQTKEMVFVDDSWLTKINSDWIKKGEYWYYVKPLKAGEQVEFCRGLQVPDFNDLPYGLKFSVLSRAEAVQAAHVTPDFLKEEPFAGILIEGNSGCEYENETVCGFEIRYENGAETIVQADGLFDEIETWMPGDCYCEKVVISNKNPVDILVKIKEICGEVDEILWNKLQLTIRRDDTILYQSGFSDHSLQNGLTLGVFHRNSEEIVEFEVELPESETNETAFKQVELAMVFSVERKMEKFSDDTEESSETGKNKEMYSYPDPAVKKASLGGTWKLIDEKLHKWEYRFEDGSKAKNGWMYLLNPYSPDEEKYNWFCFDEKGIMQFGWIRTENGNWYFCHEVSDGNLGKLKRGWHLDGSDKRTYYLDPVTGIMQTGWRKIGEQMYYFTPLEFTKRQNWFWNTEIGRWLYDFLGYRTYGSMYQNEITPDGYYVDENGVWNGQD